MGNERQNTDKQNGLTLKYLESPIYLMNWMSVIDGGTNYYLGDFSALKSYLSFRELYILG